MSLSKKPASKGREDVGRRYLARFGEFDDQVAWLILVLFGVWGLWDWMG